MQEAREEESSLLDSYVPHSEGGQGLGAGQAGCQGRWWLSGSIPCQGFPLCPSHLPVTAAGICYPGIWPSQVYGAHSFGFQRLSWLGALLSQLCFSCLFSEPSCPGFFLAGRFSMPASIFRQGIGKLVGMEGENFGKSLSNKCLAL